MLHVYKKFLHTFYGLFFIEKILQLLKNKIMQNMGKMLIFMVFKINYNNKSKRDAKEEKYGK